MGRIFFIKKFNTKESFSKKRGLGAKKQNYRKEKMRAFLFLLFFSFSTFSNTPQQPLSKEDLQFRMDARRYFDATKSGNLKLVRNFIDNYSDRTPPVINHLDLQGWTGLHNASFHGHLHIVIFLLASGADVNAWNNTGLTPLHMVAFSQDPRIANALIDKDADINALNRDGLTPLHVAIQRNNLPVIRTLLSRWADILIRTKSGKTALHIAMKADQHTVEEIIRILLIDVSKSDETKRKQAMRELITAKDVNGNTALHDAVAASNFKAVKALLEYKDYIDINAQNNFNETPAHQISSQPIDKAILSLLIQTGARMNIPNENNQTPRDIAKLRFPDIAESIEKELEMSCYSS